MSPGLLFSRDTKPISRGRPCAVQTTMGDLEKYAERRPPKGSRRA